MKNWGWLLWCLGFIGNALLWIFFFIVLLVSSCNDNKKETHYNPYATPSRTTTNTRTTTSTTNNYYNNYKTTNTKSNNPSDDYRRLQYWSYDDYKERVPEEHQEEYPYKEYIEDRVYQNRESGKYSDSELANQLWVDEAEIREYSY